MEMERRREGRVPLEMSVSYSGEGKGTHQSLTENVSTSGMCLKSNGHFSVGASFKFLLGLPGDQSAETMGRVQWQSPDSRPPRAGIQFSKSIEFALPLSAVEEALHRSAEQIDSLFHRLYQSFGEACVWVDSAGKITECDRGFRDLLGYPEEEVKGQALSDFAGPEDQERLSQLLTRKRSPFSSSSKGLFRMKPKQGPSLLSRVWMAPGSSWKASTAICLEHIAEFGALFQEMNKLRNLYTKNVSQLVALRDEKQQTENIVAAIKRSFPGWMVVLNKDLSIRDIACLGISDPEKHMLSSFKGMHLSEATGLLEVRLEENKLCDELQSCTESKQEFVGTCCRYTGRSDKKPDLFPPGTFNITISPVPDQRGEIESLLMAVVPLPKTGAEKGIDSEALRYIQQLLGTAATGLTVQSVLGGMLTPFTSLLARLNLLRHKLALGKIKTEPQTDAGGADTAAEFTKIEWQMERLSRQLTHLLEQAGTPETSRGRGADMNECMANAVHMVSSDDEPVNFSPEIGLPKVGIGDRDCTMIFVILLLLARESVRRVSDKTVNCKLKAAGRACIAQIQHRAYISEPKYTDIMLDNESPETLLLRHRPNSVLGTLLCYASLLFTKNNIKVKIKNIPGNFRLSLHLPALGPDG